MLFISDLLSFLPLVAFFFVSKAKDSSVPLAVVSLVVLRHRDHSLYLRGVGIFEPYERYTLARVSACGHVCVLRNDQFLFCAMGSMDQRVKEFQGRNHLQPMDCIS